METPQVVLERRARRPARERASTLKRLVVAWSFGVCGLAVVALQTSVPVESLLLDASVVGGGHWYSGLVTSLGVFGWTVAAVSLLGGAHISRLCGRRGAAGALGSFGVIVLVLLFDDLLLLHSSVVPRVIGGPKWLLLAFEFGVVGAWAVRFRAEIVRTRWELLIAAGLSFAWSVGFDRFPLTSDRWALVVEDSGKMLGVLALATWAVSTTLDLVGSLVQAEQHHVSAAHSTSAPSSRRELHGGHQDVVA